MKGVPASFLGHEMILGIPSSKHLVSLTQWALWISREDLRAACWILITLCVTSHLRTLHSDSSAGTEWKIVPWALGLYLLGDSQSSKTAFFQTAQKSKLDFDDCSVLLLVAETQSHVLAPPPADLSDLCQSLDPSEPVSFLGKCWGVTF